MKKLVTLFFIIAVIVIVVSYQAPTMAVVCNVDFVSAQNEVFVTSSNSGEQYSFFTENFSDFTVGEDILCTFEGCETDRGTFYDKIVDAEKL